jgi:SAM-dependent methyltransferase
MATARAHWEHVYAEKDPRAVSWYEPSPDRSLALIEEARLGPDAAIIDVGGGASGLAGALLEAGFTDVTVADISPAALERARAGLGDAARRVHWIEADVRDHDFGRRCDLWHDRAAFHFMVDAGDRDAYVWTLRRALRPGGHLIVATFGPEGPTRCSGLPVARYGAEELAGALGEDFRPVSASLHEHRTPGGAVQPFLYAHLSRAAD